MKPQMTFMANGRCILVLALTAVMGGLSGICQDRAGVGPAAGQCNRIR